MYIEDPMDPSNNVARSVDMEGYEKIRVCPIQLPHRFVKTGPRTSAHISARRTLAAEVLVRVISDPASARTERDKASQHAPARTRAVPSPLPKPDR